MAVFKFNPWMAVVVVALTFGFASPETSVLRVSRLRVRRAKCSGRPSEVNQFCRWPDLECACVSGSFCSPSSDTCEVCQTSSPDCTSPCLYPCRNGGTCLWADRCQCPPEYWGIDCSTRRGVPPPEVTTTEVTRTNPPVSRCNGKQCLNGGRCEGGACVCQMGYDLPDCSLCLPRMHPRKCLDHCHLECKNGDCLTVHQRCHCSVDYKGEVCNLCVPAKAYMNCTNYCSPMCINGATCNVDTRRCECMPGWMGEACHQPCPRGTFGSNCLGHCQCAVGSCHPVTGRCLCGPDAPSSPDCATPCECLVDGVCYSKADCPTGETPDSPNKLPLTALPLTTSTKNLQDKNLASSSREKPMMMLVVATTIGSAVLLVVVVILIVCLVRARRKNKRKPGQSQEAERVPMTDNVAGNTYDDASSMPIPAAQASSAPYRPTSGYEDVSNLHQNMPDLLQKRTEPDISPYATTGNFTVHTESAPTEYAYVSVDELKVLKGGEKSMIGDSYDKLDFLPRERSIRRPVAAEGSYGSLQDDGRYEDASSCLIARPLVEQCQDASNDSSGYAKMSPSLNNRKAASLKQPKEDLRSGIQRKTASLKLPSNEVVGTPHGAKQSYENTYVGFDPKKSPRNAKPRMDSPPPPPPPGKKPQPSTSSSKKPKGEIPQYAKPNKRKSQRPDQQEVPHYAKPNKRKSDVPECTKPNGTSSSGDHRSGGQAGFGDQVERPHAENKKSALRKPAADYAHLMDAVSPTPDTNINEI